MVFNVKLEELKSYAPFAPQTPSGSGQEGLIGRLILLFLKKCVVQSSRLVGIDQHQDVVETPVVVQHMFGIPDAVFCLIRSQKLTK